MAAPRPLRARPRRRGIALLVAAVPLPALADGVAVRGVAPEDQAKYAGDTFSCLGASAGSASLPASAVNDNFCDCEDGSDEPGTSACAGQRITLFHCPNEGSVAAFVYASRVNDGVCDCCDGSDEWSSAPGAQAALPEWQRSRGGPPRQTPCPNTCAQEGRAIFKERARKEADLVSGIKTRKALIETAKREAVDAGKELETVRAQLPQLEEAEQKAKAAVDAAKEKAEQIRKKLEKAAEKSEAAATTTTTTTAPASEGVMPEGAAPEGGHAPEGGAEGGAVISEYTKWMEGAEKVDGLEGAPAKEATEDEQEEDFDPDDEDVNIVKPPGALTRFFAKIPGVEWLRKKMFGEGKPAHERAVDDAEKAHREAQSKVRESRVRVTDLERKVREAESEDEERLAYSSLDGRCINKKVAEYKYEVCFFDKAKQDSTSIGKWKGWEAPGVAKFDDGQYCPGGPERSLKVVFECAASEEILDVTEPSRCTYQAAVAHPAACREDLLEAIRSPGPRLPTEEL